MREIARVLNTYCKYEIAYFFSRSVFFIVIGSNNPPFLFTYIFATVGRIALTDCQIYRFVRVRLGQSARELIARVSSFCLLSFSYWFVLVWISVGFRSRSDTFRKRRIVIVLFVIVNPARYRYVTYARLSSIPDNLHGKWSRNVWASKENRKKKFRAEREPGWRETLKNTVPLHVMFLHGVFCPSHSER